MSHDLVQVREYVRENRVFEKAFVKETRFTGKEQLAGAGDVDVLNVEERIVEQTPYSPPCTGSECVRPGIAM